LARAWAVESESSPGKQYVVKLLDDGRYACTCPDFFYRRRECKHIRRIRAELEAEEPEILESPIARNPLIRWDRIQRRAYQIRIAESAIGRNTLVVLPTALGKTMIAAYLAAHYLLNYADRKVLVMAPTRPLVHQHFNAFISVLRIKPSEAKILTGEVEPAYRLHWWRDPGVKIFFATPEVVRNDLDMGLNLRNFSLLVFDEAHRARKSYAYSVVAEAYMRQSPCPVILGLTASPGGDEGKVREIVDKLFIEHIEYRSESDEDVRKYVHGVETEYKVVEPPQSYGKYVQALRAILNEQLRKLMAAGALKKDPEHVSRRDLLEMGEALRFDLHATMLDEERGMMWDLVMAQSIALIALHAIELLLSQGPHAFKKFLERVLEEKGRRAHRRLARDPRLREILEMMEREGLEEHPKIPALLQLLREEAEKNPSGRILVFTQYRDSAEHIAATLKRSGLEAEIFVGHGRSGGGKPAMSQKQQLEVLRRFRDGELRVLVATSIGEEGLDIPQCDLVVFYEPVPSEIRLIQRRGRTGRVKEGRCVILVADKTADIAYLVKASEKARKMRSIMEKINRSLPPRKRRIWGEANPLSEDYMNEADRELEELLRAGAREPMAAGAKSALEEVEARSERPTIQRVPGAPEAIPLDLLLRDEEELLRRSFRSSVGKAARRVLRIVLRRGWAPISQLIRDLEWDGFSEAAVRKALEKLTSSHQIYCEGGVAYPYARKAAEAVRRRDPDARAYRIYVEEAYPGRIVVLVNERWRAAAPAELVDSPIPLRKGREYVVLGKLLRLNGKLNIRIYGVLRGEA